MMNTKFLIYPVYAHLHGVEFISLPNQLLNLEITMDVTGGWTGTYYRRAIGGKIR